MAVRIPEAIQGEVDRFEEKRKRQQFLLKNAQALTSFSDKSQIPDLIQESGFGRLQGAGEGRDPARPRIASERAEFEGERHEFVDRLERAWYATSDQFAGPTARLDFMLSLPEEDLRFFEDPAFQEEVLPEIFTAGNAFLARREEEKAARELAQRIYEENLRAESTTDNLIQFAQGLLSPLPSALGLDIFDPEAEIPEGLGQTPVEGEEFSQADLDLARRIRSGETDLAAEGLTQFIKGGEALLTLDSDQGEQVVQNVLGFVGQGIMGLSAAFSHNPLNYLTGEAFKRDYWLKRGSVLFGRDWVEENAAGGAALPTSVQEQRDRLERSREGDLYDERLEKIRAGVLPDQVWQQMEQESPEQIENLIEMYGSRELARMGFALEFEDLAEAAGLDPEQATEDIANDMFNQAESYLDRMDEANWGLENNFMETLTVYDDFVMSLGANTLEAVGAAVEDGERMELAREGHFAEFLHATAVEVEKGGHTPAGVMGLEGTFTGFLANLGAGIVFDPINWIVGPSFKVGMGVATRGAVRLVMKSPAMRLWVRGLARELAERGPGAAQVLNNLTEVGLAGRVLEEAGLADPVLTSNLWLTHKTGSRGRYADVERVYGMLDDVQLRQIDELDPKVVEQAKQTLKNADSFDRPIPVEYDEVTGRVTVMMEGDELAVLKAYDELVQETGKTGKTPIVLRRAGKQLSQAERNAARVALKRWQADSRATRATADAMAEGRPVPPEGARDVNVLLRNLDPELNPKALDHPTLYRGDSVPTGEFPAVGETVSLPLRSSTSRAEVAAEFRKSPAEAGTHSDVQYVIEDGPALRNDVAGAFEQEYLVSGEYVVTKVDGETVHLSYRGTAMDTPQSVVTGPKGPTLAEMEVRPPSKVDWTEIDGAEYASPTQLFDDEFLGVGADPKRMAAVVQQAIERGATLPGMTMSWGAIGLRQLVQKFARSKSVEWLEPMLRTTFNANTIPGQGGVRRGLEMVQFLKRSDEWGYGWTQRILQNEKALGKAKLEAATQSERITRLWELDQRLAHRQMHESPASAREVLVEEAADLGIDDVVIDRMNTIDEIRFQVRQQLRDERAAAIEETMNKHGAASWQSVYDEMLEDYNRNFIATHPEWADRVDPETGLVPWEEIHRGFNPEDLGFTVPSPGKGRQERLAQVVKDRIERAELKSEFAEIDSNELLRAFSGNEGAIGDVELPATPIELAAAAEMGGARYTKWTQDAFRATVRYGGHVIDQMWKANVLISPRTFMVMSVDELTSLMHAGGIDFVSRYLRARTDKLMARLMGDVDKPVSLVGSGGRRLSSKTQERLRLLDSIPDETRKYENAIAEGVSQDLIYMERGMLGYDEAARMYGRSFIENPAMRHYLMGEDAFRQWFDSHAGQEWSLGQTVKGIDEAGNEFHRPFRNWEEAFEYADNRWRILEQIAVEEGLDDVAAFRQAFEETAAKVGVERTGKVENLPQWVNDYFGPIPGHRPVYPGASMLWPAVGRAFQMGAANPAAFRQGLAAEMMRLTEKTRLKALFESQGKTILSDAELYDLLAAQGVDASAVNQFNSPVIDHYLLDQGMVTEGYIGRLAEHRARDFANNMTYSFEQGSRMGRQGAAIFPFGRAWGEMFGRWGRMLGSRAMARPWLRRLGLESTVQKMLDLMPINPRTAAFLSKTAGRSLEITGGLAGERETDLDFSPITFLPTQEGGLQTLIPGFGIFAVGMLDGVIDHVLPSPEEDPMAYQSGIDAISQFIPGMQLHGRGIISRFAGGGNIGVALNTAVEGVRGSLLPGEANRSIGQFTGNVRAALIEQRAVRAALADPEVLNDLLNAESTEEAAAQILANLTHASNEASKMNLFSGLLGWTIPARGAVDTNLDEVYGVWVQAARNQPDLFSDVTIPEDDVLKGDPELLLKTGDTIRRRFFSLDPAQRDLLVATNPTLAINIVGGWEWSDAAPDSLPGREPGMAYRTVGSAPDDESLQESLTRHNLYVRRGWVVPRDPNTLPHEIVGTIMDAQRRSASHLYEEVAAQTNDLLWNQILTEDDRDRLDTLAQRPEFRAIGIEEGRQLWEQWATQRQLLEEKLADELGLDPDDELIDEALGDITRELTATEDAWSTDWQGDRLDNYSKRRLGSQIILTPELQEFAETLGVEATEGMSGEEFVGGLIDYRSNTRGPAWFESRLAYSDYVDKRGAAFAAGMETLNDLAVNTNLSSDFREHVDNFVKWTENATELNEGRITRALQEEAVARFQRLREQAGDDIVNWERLWHRAFQPRYGPLGWEPPPPAPLFLEDGSQNPEAWTPFIQDVVDGDTLVVSENRGPSLLDIDLLPKVDVGPEQGIARGHGVRLLGVYSEDYYNDPEKAEEQRNRLEDALMDARRNGDRIYLVRDPEYAGGRTDPFGRELAWLYIGDEPYYFPEELSRGQ